MTSSAVLRGTTIDVAGMAIAMSASDLTRADAVAALFRHARIDVGTAAATFTFEAVEAAIPSTRPDAVVDGMSFWHLGSDRLFLRSDAALTAEVSGRSIIIGGDACGSASAFRVVAFLALTHLFAQHGRHLLHAGAVSDGDRALLIVGASGTGKSTAVLAARRAGWSVLGDDMVVLQRSEDGLTVEGVHRPIAVEPELVGAEATARRVPDDPRGRVELPPGTLASGAQRIVGVIVPAHGHTPQTGCEPLAATDTLHAVLAASTSLADPTLVPEVFALAGALARLPAWTLAHGSDPAVRIESGAACFETIRSAP